MKSALFARPNLKGFLLLAVLIVALKQFITSGEADNGTFPIETISRAVPQEHEIERLIRRAMVEPTSANYVVLSDCYRKRGDTRKAMHYLRKASILADWEETDP